MHLPPLLNPPSRTGKIARLPAALREELNRRLQDGNPGRSLVQWLNSLPEVRAVLAANFGGHPIREQNLSQWRKGGYRDWLERQEARLLAERAFSSAWAAASDPDSQESHQETGKNPSAGGIDLQRKLRSIKVN